MTPNPDRWKAATSAFEEDISERAADIIVLVAEAFLLATVVLVLALVLWAAI